MSKLIVSESLIKRDQQKEQLIEFFRKTPIVQVACEKLGIGRASYYRWRKEDEKFRVQADEALLDGSHIINDLAESQLISAIKDRDLGAIIFWLKYRHPHFKAKVELSGGVEISNKPLSDEQKKSITKALKLASMLPKK